MHRKSSRSFRLLTVIMVAVVLLLPISSHAQTTIYIPLVQQAGGSSPTDIVSSGADEVQAAANYWTKERMEAAKPLDLLRVTGSPPSSDRLVEQADGPAGKVRGGMPDANAEALARSLFASEWAAIDETEMELTEELEEETVKAADNYYPYPPPFTRYTVNKQTALWKQYPWRAVGKVFFTIPGQGNYVCSGSVAVGRAVWTAGHCVFTLGVGWHTNVLFVPAYRNGSAPYGTFNSKELWSLTGWTQSEDFAYDIGMIVTNDRNSKKVSQWVGYLGYSYNQSSLQHFDAFGYPVGIEGGNYLITCEASTSRTDTSENPATIGIGCDMLGGSSGGPRLIKYTPFLSGANNYVNGVNSYYYTCCGQEVFSPYFATGARNLYDSVKNR